MSNEEWGVEVYSGYDYVGKMTEANGDVAVFDKGEKAMAVAQKFKTASSLGIWCKLVKLNREGHHAI
ncbi:hypothetical protein AB684_11105 [Bacillus licheniformis]|uniref:Uncharacterized protein n=1 Tax=Bacillus licheniformis TaxID=1402 RepID=A0AB37GGQ7_BACLI|nr:hypothetical protein [Bacillus licheniformis]AMR10704.1 hypothetical protein AB684_11105 [Bacillus licheniformis]KJH58771.1 hypothetical protein UF14_10235 [Bacillus licheniformis]KYC83584.1 hypothetical protein B4091_2162 [Bacillus licheniformis]MCM3374114.1 hypothetical protein [Bacillus licheniformis]MCM3433535.1 hypothetical protein [Bacillus licheniformis]